MGVSCGRYRAFNRCGVGGGMGAFSPGGGGGGGRVLIYCEQGRLTKEYGK